jgi:hypothetical protein
MVTKVTQSLSESIGVSSIKYRSHWANAGPPDRSVAVLCFFEKSYAFLEDFAIHALDSTFGTNRKGRGKQHRCGVQELPAMNLARTPPRTRPFHKVYTLGDSSAGNAPSSACELVTVTANDLNR